MAVNIQCKELLITDLEIQQLWQETIRIREFSDETVSVRCVIADEIKELNKKYRKKDKVTNVLTFSYQPWVALKNGIKEEAEHDVVICLSVAKEESLEHQVDLRDYTALLLVHAFLHVTGMDHEASEEAAQETREMEKKVLMTIGFKPIEL